MFISAVLEPILHLLYKYYGFQQYQEVEWITSNSLQLHRLAQEELGHGEWIKCDDDIPITTGDTYLGTMKLDDYEHPVINKPLKVNDDEKPASGNGAVDTGVRHCDGEQESGRGQSSEH